LLDTNFNTGPPTTMDPHRPDMLVRTTLLALSTLAILISFRGLFPHQSDDGCAAIVHSIDCRESAQRRRSCLLAIIRCHPKSPMFAIDPTI
jgi:hypothetical protein